MRTIIEAWKRDAEYRELKASLHSSSCVQLSGLPLLPRAALAAALFEDTPCSQLLLTADEDEAAVLTDNLRPFVGDRARHFPSLELLPFQVYARNIELIADRVNVLSGLCRGEKMLVVCSVGAFCRRLAPPQVFAAHHLTLAPGQIIRPDELTRRLTDMGYERSALTEIPGMFSTRGSIIDVFPITSTRPLRLEFFDDEIESVRYFDPSAQRSADDAGEADIPPARELPWDEAARKRAELALAAEYATAYEALHGEPKKELSNTYSPLLEYLPEQIWDSGMEALTCHFYPQAASLLDYMDDGLVIVSEPRSLRRECEEQSEERLKRYADLLESGRLLPSFFNNFFSFDDLRTSVLRHRLLLLPQLLADASFGVPQREFSVVARELPLYATDPEGFIRDVREYLLTQYDVMLTASSDMRMQRLAEIMRENGSPAVRLVQAPFTAGFVCQRLKLVVMTENELFARRARKRARRSYGGGEKIANFLDLREGDYVVHVHQGVGRYMGVHRLKVGDVERDYLLLEYAGSDKLYVPVDQLDLIQKYVGSDSASPKLYKLGGGDWNRVKARVRASVREMAEQLIKLYAAREQAVGFAFSPDGEWQREFEDAFPYVETADQLSAAAEIKHDMEQVRVMDRLLCGDVGYGKTEIALRAAFKAVMDGKQVAILVPTTVLAQQHYRTMCQRFASFPLHCGSLSRFNSAKEQKEVLRKLAAGELDVVVGTHRLLSKDVRFRDLGLLIIDEEQRFGVAHKEKIKELRTQVDALTLSATPIPRTLHMALTGMRDMSVITTPPEERIPVQTYVVEFHERMIRDAIARELGRGGQVFYVHNRVIDIYEQAEMLRRLLPSARIAVGHGQMREGELEQVMLDFVAGEADVLVCTTIIESGLDIPNVNTLIVNEADMYGLAQLYQLRGRVGRSTRQAFAYFTYRRDRVITDIARQRLTAIRDFTELGSGFKIAMRDLELRGAGNILGPEQHGHIAAVGFDLYCHLLQEEMDKLRGAAPTIPQVTTQIDLSVSAFIPDSFVSDAVLKVELYKRLAAAENFAQISEFSSELTDRYGQLPLTVESLLQIGRIKLLGRWLAVSSVTQKTGVVELKFAEGHPVKMQNLLSLMDDWGSKLVFSEKKGFSIMLRLADLRSDAEAVDLTLQLMYDLYRQVNKGGAADVTQ